MDWRYRDENGSKVTIKFKEKYGNLGWVVVEETGRVRGLETDSGVNRVF